MLGASSSVPPLKGRRILAFRSGALGDALFALPALAALRREVGASGTLELVGREPFVQLLLTEQHAAKVFSIDRVLFAGLHDEAADDRDLLEFLRGYDVVVSWSKLPLLGLKAASIGLETIEAPPHPPAGLHAADHLFRALASLGIAGATPLPELVLSGESRRRALDFLGRRKLAPARFVAVHPSSGSPKKNWPIRSFVELARLARGDGFDVLWIEGEADGGVVSTVTGELPAPVARNLPLDVLGALLAESGAFVGNDSGVTHLAAAVGAPTFALFGPTDPRMWAPRGRAATVVDFGESVRRLWEKALERCRRR